MQMGPVGMGVMNALNPGGQATQAGQGVGAALGNTAATAQFQPTAAPAQAAPAPTFGPSYSMPSSTGQAAQQYANSPGYQPPPTLGSKVSGFFKEPGNIRMMALMGAALSDEGSPAQRLGYIVAAEQGGKIFQKQLKEHRDRVENILGISKDQMKAREMTAMFGDSGGMQPLTLTSPMLDAAAGNYEL